MTIRVTPLFPVSFWLATLVLGLSLPAGPAAAQERRAEAVDLKSDESRRFHELRDGKQLVDDRDKDLLNKAAQFYVNRLTWTEFQRSPTRGVNELVIEATREIPVPTPTKPLSDNQKAFVQEYSKVLVLTIKKVLKNPEPIARVSAARILAYLGRAGQNDFVGNSLADMLEDNNQTDAVKFWALQGLKDLLASPPGPKPPVGLARWLQVLANWADQPDKMVKNASPEAERYLRREAIRALGQAQLPAGAGGKPPVALLLARVLANDGVTPSPGFTEQLEAAIGLCQMQSKLYPDYQPAYAASLIGQFVVEFAKRFNERGKAGGQPEEWWKIQAPRFLAALDRLRQDAGDKDKYVADVVSRATKIVKDIAAARDTNAGDFREWLTTNQPKAASLYKGDAKSAVKYVESE